MRCVEAPQVAVSARPSAARLESVRHLGRRFPDAKLREATLVRAPELDARADASGATRVWLALESLQVTGSFKIRGALAALDAHRGERIVAASAGNHGAAVAYASSVLGVQATVYVPRAAPRAKREKIAKYAELVVVDSDHYDDAEAQAKQAAAARGAAFVSAYDDEDVVLGNGASLGFEIVRALGRVPAHLLAPFGGGGLATGLGWAMAADAGGAGEGARGVVWGAQSEASCAMAMSLEGGRAVERLETGGTTLAEGLEGGIAADAFARARAVVGGVLVVSETQIAAAMANAFRELGLVLEGSAAVGLVPLFFGLPESLRGGDIVAVLTGRNVDPERLVRVLSMA